MSIIQITDSNFKQLLGEEKPLLVKFQAPWCVYCRRIAPAYRKIAEEYEGKVLVGEVNIDDYPQLARELQVELVPTLTVFREGKAVGSIVAPDSKAKIEALLREALNME